MEQDHRLLPPKEARRAWRALPFSDRARIWDLIERPRPASSHPDARLAASLAAADLRFWKRFRWVLIAAPVLLVMIDAVASIGPWTWAILLTPCFSVAIASWVVTIPRRREALRLNLEVLSRSDGVAFPSPSASDLPRR